MAIDLNCQSVVIYNNTYLGSLMHASVESEGVYDELGSFQYWKNRLTVETIIPGDQSKSNFLVDTTDTLTPNYGAGRAQDIVHLMRKRLGESRKALYILNSGFGNVVIDGQPADAHLSETDIETFLNTTFDTSTEFPPDASRSSHQDLDMGPTPRVLRWEPIGANRAVRVVWECDFHTKECIMYGSNGTYELNRIASFTYRYQYTYDDNYLATRTVSGEVKFHTNVATTLDGDSLERFRLSADQVRDTVLLNFPAPDNYKRHKKDFRIDNKHSTLEYVIVDKEIDSGEPYPPGITEIEVDHEMVGKGPAFAKFENSLTANITVSPKGYAYYYAFRVFADICLKRLERGFSYNRELKKIDEQGVEIELTRQQPPIPTRLRVKESLYRRTRRFEFEFSWTSFAKKPEDIFAATGMFTSISNDLTHRWSTWKDSIRDIDKDNRGITNVTDNHNGIIVNSCLSQAPADTAQSAASLQTFQDELDDNGDFNDSQSDGNNDSLPLFDNTEQDITEENSILAYRNKVILQGTSQDYEYQVNKIEEADLSQVSNYGDFYGEGGTNMPSFSGGEQADFLKKGTGKATRSIEVTPPSTNVVIVGRGVRMKGPIPAPKLLKVGGADVELVDSTFVHDIQENSLSVPIYESMWKLVYRMKDTPRNASIEADGEVHPSY